MTPAEFKLRYPEFSLTLDATIQTAIDEAAPFFDVARWGLLYSKGLAAYVAHELTLSGITATSSSEAIDSGVTEYTSRDMTEKFDARATAGQATNPYLRTLYGQVYMLLRQSVGTGVYTV